MESVNPLVSCIVPVYNGERFLAETLASIFAQTYKPIELILIDDGSTDGTRAVVEPYRDRLQYIRQDQAGVAAATNHGIRTAQGEFISFLDADDLWLADKTEKQMNLLAAMPHAGASVTLIQNFWMEELRHEEIAMQNHRHAKPMPGYAFQSLLVRRAALDHVGLLDESLHQATKTAWFFQAQHLGIHIELLDEVLVKRRMHLASYSRNEAARSQLEHLRVVKKYKDLKRAKPK